MRLVTTVAVAIDEGNEPVPPGTTSTTDPISSASSSTLPADEAAVDPLSVDTLLPSDVTDLDNNSNSNNNNNWAARSCCCVGNSMRWFGLASICFFMTAEYYSIDIPAALHQDLKDYLLVAAGGNDKNKDETDDSSSNSSFEMKFNLLYTVYSIPNVALPLLGGYFVDKWGPTFCMIGYSLCLCLGQALFAIGLDQKSWAIMLLGRMVFGLGGESICVANSTLLTEWFDHGERAFAFGILNGISRLGSVLNNIVSPKVAHTFATPWALWLGVLFNTTGVVAACFVQYLESLYQKKGMVAVQVDYGGSSAGITRESIAQNLLEPLLPNDGNETEEMLVTDTLLESNGRDAVTETTTPQLLGSHHDNPPTEISDSAVGIKDIASLGSTFWLLCICCMVVYGCVQPFNNVASGILLERNFFRPAPEDCKLTFPRQCTAGSLVKSHSNPAIDCMGNNCPGEGFAPLLPTLPLLNVSYDHYDPQIDTNVNCEKSFWANECTHDYCSTLHQATETAGKFMSIPYALAAILSPPIGTFVDRVGRRAALACGTSLTLMSVHLILALAPSHTIPLWVPLLGQGLAYALFSAVIWPSVGMVVEKKMTGTAYGIILAMQNTGLALFPLLVATIYKHSEQKYIPNVELLFVGCAAVGSMAGMLLFVLDRRNGNKLSRVGAQDE